MKMRCWKGEENRNNEDERREGTPEIKDEKEMKR
jgi:hypothetical protein